MDDYLLDLARVPSIAKVLNLATQSLDQVSWDRNLRNRDESFGVYVRRLSGYSSAALDGAHFPTDVMSDPDDSAMGQLSNAALMITSFADENAPWFIKSPRQVWAQLHLLVPGADTRGQPRTNNDVPDLLHLGHLPDSSLVHPMLNGLSEVIVESQAPAVLVAAITHAQLCAIRPFPHGSYLVARASSRMILKARGFDALGLCAVEHGLYRIGRPAYVKALSNFMMGGVESVSAYVSTFCQAIVRSTEVVRTLGPEQTIKS